MALARKPHTAGNVVRYLVDYSQWLERGTTLTAVAVAIVSPLVDVTISAGDLTKEGRVEFFVSGGSVSEIFTVSIQVTNTRGEVKHDTVDFFVTAP